MEFHMHAAIQVVYCHYLPPCVWNVKLRTNV